MNLDELFTEIQKDFRIDRTNLGHESARSGDLFSKYIKLFSEEKLKLELLYNQKKKLVIEKRDYYSGNADPEVYKVKPFDLRIKSEAVLEKYISSDSDIVKYDERILLQRQKVEILEACIDQQKRHGFAVKSAIDWEKFLSGA